jgi:hypothetical protein
MKLVDSALLVLAVALTAHAFIEARKGLLTAGTRILSSFSVADAFFVQRTQQAPTTHRSLCVARMHMSRDVTSALRIAAVGRMRSCALFVWLLDRRCRRAAAHHGGEHLRSQVSLRCGAVALCAVR